MANDEEAMSERTKYYYPAAYRARKNKLKIKKPRRTGTPTPVLACFRKGLIDRNEYFAASFFLKLFRLRYGEHMIRACSFGNRDSEYQGIKSEKWYEESNVLYQLLVKELQKKQLLRTILNICVYESYPDFLKDDNFSNKKNYPEYQTLKLGLEIICDFLQKNYSN